jgi:AbrB family looped-hinge helix DNA binding protein
MQAVAAQISSRYQIVIPKPVRQALGIGPQDALLFVIEDGTVTVRPRPASLTTALRGLHAELWPDPDRWLEEERSSWE